MMPIGEKDEIIHPYATPSGLQLGSLTNGRDRLGFGGARIGISSYPYGGRVSRIWYCCWFDDWLGEKQLKIGRMIQCTSKVRNSYSFKKEMKH